MTSNLHSLKLAALTAASTAVLAAGILALPAAQASIWSSSTGGAMCKGSSGTSAPLFYYANTFAQNTSSSNQFLTCGFTDVHSGNSVRGEEMWIGVGNPTGASVSFTCAIQSGYAGGAGVVNTAVRTDSVSAGADSFIYITDSSTPAIPAKGSAWSPYTVSCQVPAQGKIGLLTLVMPGTV